MWFKNGKNPFIKPSRHVLFEGESGRRAGCAPQRGAARQPPAARCGTRAPSQLWGGGRVEVLTVNSEIRVHCNCCRCRTKHTNQVGPATAGGLVQSGREKKAENQWNGRVEPVFDSKYCKWFGTSISPLVVLTLKNGNNLSRNRRLLRQLMAGGRQGPTLVACPTLFHFDSVWQSAYPRRRS